MPDKTPVATYEALFARLQDIVARLETGELPLEESLRLYEHGVQLAAQCQQVLDTAELRIQELQIGNTTSADWKE